jgi:hypothetical protein
MDVFLKVFTLCLKILCRSFAKCIVTCFSDYRRGFRLVNKFIDHLQVVTTNNYYTPH